MGSFDVVVAARFIESVGTLVVAVLGVADAAADRVISLLVESIRIDALVAVVSLRRAVVSVIAVVSRDVITEPFADDVNAFELESERLLVLVCSFDTRRPLPFARLRRLRRPRRADVSLVVP